MARLPVTFVTGVGRRPGTILLPTAGLCSSRDRHHIRDFLTLYVSNVFVALMVSPPLQSLKHRAFVLFASRQAAVYTSFLGTHKLCCLGKATL